MKLEDAVLGSEGSLRWINTATETIRSKALQRVVIESWNILVNHREWGPRPPASPALDLTLGSPNDFVH